MNFRLFASLLAMLTALLTVSAPKTAMADNVTVTVDASGKGDFTNIQAAIVNISDLIPRTPGTSYTISVKAGTYTGAFNPISNVPIIGSSTAGTFINGTVSVATFTAVSGVIIRNFTFQNGASIRIGGSSGVTIQNMVFNGSTTAAVTVSGSPTTSIINNTFYRNTIAINTDSELTSITNNIFSNNGTGLPANLTTPTYNDFFAELKIPSTDQSSIPNLTHADADPKFVNPPSDFRLQSGSPCIDAGNPSIQDRDGSPSDMGAFGGPNADLPPPEAVTGLSSSLVSPNMTLTWNPSSGSAVTAYRIYYGTVSNATSNFSGYNGTQATEGTSGEILVQKGTNTATLSNLPTSVAKPAAPVVTSVVSMNQALQVNWTGVAGATGYQIFFQPGDTPFTDNSLPANPITVDAGTRSFTITGLQNGTHYAVAVRALADDTFFAAVTAVIDGSKPAAPGTANESPYSNETSQQLGAQQQGPISGVTIEFPETVSPFPNLKGGGCFIATAAYGFYSTPQVQALRIFRDRYLLTNAPGRAFVAWYYRYGPRGAHFINEHPWLKAPVRVALFPLVVAAMFLVYTGALTKVAVMMSAALLALLLRQRLQVKRAMQRGGVQ